MGSTDDFNAPGVNTPGALCNVYICYNSSPLYRPEPLIHPEPGMGDADKEFCPFLLRSCRPGGQYHALLPTIVHIIPGQCDTVPGPAWTTDF